MSAHHASHAAAVSGACGLALYLSGLPAFAEPLRFHGALGGARAVSPHQVDELSFGGGGLVAVELPLIPELGLQLQGGGIVLAAGQDPTSPELEALGTATSFSVGVGPRIYPLARLEGAGLLSPAGLWIGGSGGFAQTGDYSRPMVDAYLGFDFQLAERLAMGPTVGFSHVFQPDSELRPADANILLAGLHVVFDRRGKRTALDDDRDRDGIRNALDDCPDRPEDKDGFQDADGCPDLDNDLDGITDAVDHCPNVPEDDDDFQDDDGCPDRDNDADGILDGDDACRDVPEDRDDFEDEDGCPDLDNDGDGIPDKEDLCPFEPETANGYADHDGCPDEEEVRVIGDKIVLDERIYFRKNSPEVREVSHQLMRRLADLMVKHPEYVHVQIVGHADERGPRWFNEELSRKRAEAVRALLVQFGVGEERLSASGVGASQPAVDKSSERAWFLNRRVELIVTREVKQTVRTDTQPMSKRRSNPKNDEDPAVPPRGRAKSKRGSEQ